MKGLRAFSWVFCFIFMSSWLQARTPARAIDEKATQETLHISLNGQWKLYYFPQGEHQIRHPDQLKTQGLTAIQATVPGEAVLELSRKGVLPADLLYGENIMKLKPYELYEWWYQREFPTPVGITGRRVELLFHEVDCLATYWLNGKPLGETANALIEHHFDVTGKLNSAGPNLLTIRLRSPVIEADSKEYDPAYRIYSGRTNQEAAWIRRAPHSFGMDIMPRAISAGLWRPAELVVHARHEITNMYFATTSVESGRARLAVAFELATDLALLPQLQLKVEGHCGDSTFSYTHKVEFSKGWFEFDVQNPRLWWPRGYGDANRYEVTTRLLQNGEAIASRREMIGIRKLELIRTETSSPEKPGQFLFQVNGVPILVKGSDWLPTDTFHSRDGERYEKVLALFADLDCNMLRAGGWGIYEDDAFFDICDRYGIMVWQEFALSNGMYPQTPEFLEVMRQESLAVVRRLRNHPSIALWSGDNEGDMVYAFAHLDPAQNKITRQVLPQVVFQCDPYRPYLPSSPYMSPEVIATGNLRLMPEEHLWGSREYFKSPLYTQPSAHFVSEIGYNGCPGLSSLKRFLDEQHLWPWQDNPQWILHSTSMAGDPYHNRILADEEKEFFGVVPDKIEDFILATQITQAEAKKFFIEMTRLNKWQSTGVLWWNVMDGWPQLNAAVVDYYFNKKLAYYYIRRVQRPVCVMVDEPKDWHCRVVVGDDAREDATGHYRVWDADSGETLLEGDYAVKANENLEVGTIPVFHSSKRLLLIEWTAQGKKYANHYLQGMPPFSLAQYRAWLPRIAALENDFDAAGVGK